MNLRIQQWTCILISTIQLIHSAPTRRSSDRQSKALDGLYDYYLQNDYPDPNPPQPQYLQAEPLPYDDFDENEVLSRGNFNRRHNSPIYYIRLPPAPYMFVPGLGYVSHPPSVSPLGPTPNSFINLPINFVSNGKPSNIYQWSATDEASPFNRPSTPTTTTTKKPPTKRPDSTIHRLPGKYPFNGKPTDIKILRDSYNSLYSDALQNFYP